MPAAAERAAARPVAREGRRGRLSARRIRPERLGCSKPTTCVFVRSSCALQARGLCGPERPVPVHRWALGTRGQRRNLRGDQPGHGSANRHAREGRARGCAPGRRRRARRRSRLGPHVALRARRSAGANRRRHRGAQGRAGARPDRGSGQAAPRRGLRRGRGADRLLPDGRGGRDADRGPAPAVRRSREARARLPRPEGRRRGDHAVELALHDARRAARAGARRRERRDLEPGAVHEPLCRRAGRRDPRGGPAARRLQPRDRSGRRGRRRDRGRPARRRGRLRRVHEDRREDRPAGGRQGAAARDGRQRAARHPRRRGRREGRPARRSPPAS